jgi:hypothetical protein
MRATIIIYNLYDDAMAPNVSFACGNDGHFVRIPKKMP